MEVIINSTRGSFELQAYVSGAIDFLQKPLTKSKIDLAITRMLEVNRTLRDSNTVVSTIAS